MSMCSVTDFIETSLGPERMLASTATVTGQGAPQVDGSVRGGDFSWPQVGTFVATSGDLRWPPAGTFSWPRTTGQLDADLNWPRCRHQSDPVPAEPITLVSPG